MRQNIFNLLDKMTNRKQELTNKFVPLSICTQLQQAIRDTDVWNLFVLIDFIQNILDGCC
jgi:hypothetical protein